MKQLEECHTYSIRDSFVQKLGTYSFYLMQEYSQGVRIAEANYVKCFLFSRWLIRNVYA